MKRPPVFIITTSSRLPGARLSCRMNWGNHQFDSIEAAEAEARRIGGDGCEIVRERGR